MTTTGNSARMPTFTARNCLAGVLPLHKMSCDFARHSFGWAIGGLLYLMVFPLCAEPSAADMEYFEDHVRPILAENCYSCHSLEQGKAKGGLTLDTRDGLLKGGESGVVIVPGNPDQSLLTKAIGYEDSDLQMPPKNKLTDDEITSLKQWIQMGAPDPRSGPSKLTGLTDKARSHWAYQPVEAQTVPRVKNIFWCQTPIDRFILAKLEEKGMTPSAPAAKDTLIRRAYYDLVGLPPTPREIEAFENDKSPEAFAKVVDRLLAAPEYGERWGRHWLDTARYSDTIGGDRVNQPFGMEYRYPYAWSYRDYVINSFNVDKPYDQFILEQIAADKLPEAKEDTSILAGLGFLTVGTRFRSQNDVINERIDVVTKGFLATTVTCARCHDHRFDPIPTTDYYALHGVFASSLEPAIKPIIKTGNDDLYQSFQDKLAKVEQENKEAYILLAKDVNGEFQRNIPTYMKYFSTRREKLTGDQLKAFNRAITAAGLDRSVLVSMDAAISRQPGNDATFFPFKRLMTIPDEDFAEKAPEVLEKICSRAERDFPLNPVVIEAFKEAFKDTPLASRDQVVEVYAKLFADAFASAPNFTETAFSSSAPLESDPTNSSSAPSTNSMMMDGTGMSVMMGMNNSTPNKMANAHKAAMIAATGVDANYLPFLSFPLPVELGSQLNTNEIRRLAKDLPNGLREKENREPLHIDLNQINVLELTDPGSPERAMVMVDSDRPHDSPVLIRGQDQVRGPLEPRHFLTMLSPGGKPIPFRDGSGRLELAEAIASKDNPLTARVMVNRIWMYHFGNGFVPTPDDLGNQSEPPSHPELLDYLARDFMDNGWSIKRLHRMIMLSSVYQESSAYDQSYQTIDPENRLLSHANIRRLDFESLRDSLLIFSGKMDRTIGGQPVNLTDEPYSYRRSVYGYIDRGNLPELMSQFDFSDPDMTNSRRSSTIVPQQALFLMNSPMIVGVVRDILARPEVVASANPVSKIISLYRIIFQRSPKPTEILLGLDYLATSTAPNTEHKIQPITPVVAPSASPRPNNRTRRLDAFQAIRNQGEMVDRSPLNPWESFAQALLFANEMSYVN